MGDYKLKSAQDYVVPAHKLENVEHKRRQMALIEQAINQVKMSYNSRYLELRDEQLSIVDDMSMHNARYVSPVPTPLLLCIPCPNPTATMYPLSS
jgi:hypothetical protein